MRTIRSFTSELRKQGFVFHFRDRSGGTSVTQFTKRQDESRPPQPGDRELHVQLWAQGKHRVSHGIYGEHGLRETTTPTSFETVAGMREAIEFEWTRPTTP